MKIEKKAAWKNTKCNECGRAVFGNKDEENFIYFCQLKNTTPFKKWKLCEDCFEKLFSDEVKNAHHK